MAEPPLPGDPIVLAFSGGLDTSFCVPYLAETRGRPVVTLTVDTGGLDAADLGARSRALGAAAHVRVDARRTFFDRVLRYLIFGNVRRGGTYPLCVGAERTVQAEALAVTARRLGARTVAHGCTAAGNDQVRFGVALAALAGDLEVLAPIRDEPRPRAEQVAFLEARGLPVPPTGAAYSVNRGLWGVTIGGRETLTSDGHLPEEAWVLTRGALDRPLPPSRHTVAFTAGVPTALDGEPLDPVTLLERLEAVAASHGVGRGVHLGDTVLGIKGRVAYEAPAAEVLLTAHRELEKLVLSARQSRVKDQVAATYGDMVHEGQLLDPAARDIEALLASSQARATGEVEVTLFGGHVFVEGVSSPFSLMAASRGVYGESAGEWSAADARGFTTLVSLPVRLHARAGAAAGGGPEYGGEVAVEAGGGPEYSGEVVVADGAGPDYGGEVAAKTGDDVAVEAGGPADGYEA